jgi:hypothetical protein
MEDYKSPSIWVISMMPENPICSSSNVSDDSSFEDPFVKPPFEW